MYGDTLAMLEALYRIRMVFFVQACDASMPMMCSSTDVLIYVLDFNDEFPTFDRPTYQADITENYTAGSIIMQPVAIDKDSAENAELTYTLLVS